MNMPSPAPEHEKLKAFAGVWKGEEMMYPTPWVPHGGPANARVRSRMDLGGFYLIQDYEQTREGRVTYSGHGVFGFDPKAADFTMYWFDSMSPSMGEPARGKWDGDSLVLLQRSAMGQVRYTFTPRGADRYVSKLEYSQDGLEWKPFVDGSFTRE